MYNTVESIIVSMVMVLIHSFPLSIITEDGVTNVWMYAVIAAGTFFVIFLAVGCYTMR